MKSDIYEEAHERVQKYKPKPRFGTVEGVLNTLIFSGPPIAAMSGLIKGGMSVDMSVAVACVVAIIIPAIYYGYENKKYDVKYFKEVGRLRRKESKN